MNRNPDIDPDRDPRTDGAWELLLQARKTGPGPFFARNVLREIRIFEANRRERDERASTGWRALFTLPRLAAGTVTGAAAIIIALALIKPVDSLDSPPIAEDAVRDSAAPLAAVAGEGPGFDMGDYQDEIEMIDYLDGLLAVQDITALDDASLSELLF